ncbi:MAG TPA: phosphoethanolamine--lipid A transferase [Ramlibacter sp.]|nr:phosphoethanolamine--lipid A transferase [Ramlibacter sp.]
MRSRPAVHTETLLALAAIFVLVAGNGPFWHAALASRPWAEPATWLFAGAIFVSLVSLHFALAAIFSTRHTVKPLLTLLLVATAAASYFMERYAVYLDRTMMANVTATNYKEARELLGWGMAGHVLLYGLLPSALVWWPAIKTRPWRRAAAVRFACVVGALVISVGSLLVVFADFASLMRNHREMRWLITPANALVAMVQNALDQSLPAGQPKAVVAADAKVVAPARERPMLFVLVVGETARAQNFSLNGYARQTNPELAKRGVIDFPDAKSCGTSTEVSLPCMFSAFGRAHYDERKIATHESVLNVLARAGVGVLWRDNQSGCKGVCDGLPVQQLDHENVPGICNDGQCFDEILLQGMDRVLQDHRGNMLVVMHQLGSHGPSYYKRYPPAFRKFLPACESDDLRQCDAKAIVNAYDNTILYTDFFLGKVIDFLAEAQKSHDTALLYMSDHGESLGEGGLYLHGIPYAIAPQAQTHVPFVLWMSPAFRSDVGVDEACMRTRAAQPVSHDDLFHTLLGVFDVRTSVYDPKLDIFAGCRTKQSS